MLSRGKVVVLVMLAIVAFAANSLLCRLALRTPAAIDAVAFTAIRLGSGAAVLALLGLRSRQRVVGTAGNWVSSMALFAYALAFSLAYVRIPAATGALILFAAVQLTMLITGIGLHRERPTRLQWLGLLLALAGLAVLTWRGDTAPDPLAALLMALAGISWGVYSLRGRRSRRPLPDTAGNFARATPLALVALALAFRSLHVTTPGLVLALASGILASGLGYTIWYTALPSLTATRAAVVQLAVPLAAAAGGIALLGEHATPRLLVAAATILTGIALSTFARQRA